MWGTGCSVAAPECRLPGMASPSPWMEIIFVVQYICYIYLLYKSLGGNYICCTIYVSGLGDHFPLWPRIQSQPNYVYGQQDHFSEIKTFL